MLTVESLSKSYPLRAAPNRAETLFDQALNGGRALARRLVSRRAAADESERLHWALRDLSFSVAEGEVLSVIGHNGSGKSTLLKILSRITAPTQGQVRVRGRLASLLEVGTGFHPDLSGRDNVYLNAAILGMRRAEIARRFDAIVEFSGVAAFIDTPVKHYSSGMKVRLGFAVAAHLDPDILLIDEVLAVGDAAFQQRCLNRIEEFGATGRTILYVSHHLPSVARLSKRSLVLDHGRAIFDGPTLTAIRKYEQQIGGYHSSRSWAVADAPGDERARFLAVEIHANGAPVSGPVDTRFPLELRVVYEVLEGGHTILPGLHLHDFSGNPILSSIDTHPEWHGQPRATGTYETVTRFPANFFNEGSFTIGLSLVTQAPFKCHAYLHDTLAFSVYDSGLPGSSRGVFRGELKGYFLPMLDWQTQRRSA